MGYPLLIPLLKGGIFLHILPLTAFLTLRIFFLFLLLLLKFFQYRYALFSPSKVLFKVYVNNIFGFPLFNLLLNIPFLSPINHKISSLLSEITYVRSLSRRGIFSSIKISLIFLLYFIPFYCFLYFCFFV